MTNALAFFTHSVSLLFHLSFGLVYVLQPDTYLNPPRLSDPCGFLSFSYLFDTQTPDFAVEYLRDTLIPLVFIKLAGLYMVALAALIYYDTFVVCRFQNSGNLAIVHLTHTMICMAGFRNHWADVDSIWPMFMFHLFLTLGLLKLKRVKVYDLSSDDEDYDEDDDDDEEFTPETSWSVDEDYQEDEDEEEEGPTDQDSEDV
uniref:Uncharacterized protein n=1 Tax=viral metagenome TaxID=1070528 RepID=A0A6C0BN58_9ZZZZ